MNLRIARAAKANSIIDDMQKFYLDMIRSSVRSTRMFEEPVNAVPVVGKPVFQFLKEDSVSALFECKKKSPGKRVCILNFASYKHPGGGFLNGSFAQEEALCHESFLYNVISTFDDFYQYNNAHLNRGLYGNRALYSPDIMFIRDDDAADADVLTCAAPNWGAARRNNVSREENMSALKERIAFVGKIVEIMRTDIFIAGAFGCGVFRQDPVTVCRMFTETFRCSNVKEILFAIPGGPNYEAFRKEMQKV